MDHRNGVLGEVRGRWGNASCPDPLVPSFLSRFHLEPGSLRRERPEREPCSRADYLPLIAIRLTVDCAWGVFGIVTVRTPFLKDAETLSWSTSSTGMRRSKCP